MINQLLFIALLSLWVIIFNLIMSYSDDNYHKIYKIQINTYMYYMEFGNIDSISKFYAILENDYNCEFNVQNTYVMNNIINRIENSEYVYYTRLNIHTNMCTEPVLYCYVYFEKIIFTISFGLVAIIVVFVFYNLAIKFIDLLKKLNEHRKQSYIKYENDEPGIIELEENGLFNSI